MWLLSWGDHPAHPAHLIGVRLVPRSVSQTIVTPTKWTKREFSRYESNLYMHGWKGRRKCQSPYCIR